METLHLYLFPAVGSLKEKRMCHMAPPTLDTHVQTTIDKADEAVREADAGREGGAKNAYDVAKVELGKARTIVEGAGVDAPEAMKQKLTKGEEALKKAHEKMVGLFQKKANADGVAAFGKVDTVLDVPGKLVEAQKQLGILKGQYQTVVAAAGAGMEDLHGPLREHVKNMAEIYNKVGKPAPVLDAYKPEDFLKPQKDAFNAAKTAYMADKADAAKKTAYDTKMAELKTEADKVRAVGAAPSAFAQLNIPFDMTVVAPIAIDMDKKTAAETMWKGVNALQASEAVLQDLRKETAIVAPPGAKGPETKAEEIETKYKTQIEAIKAADSKGVIEMAKAIDKVNNEIPEIDRPLFAKALEGKTTKYGVYFDTATKKIDAKSKTGTVEGREIEESSTISKIVELLVKFLRDIGALPKEMKGELTTARIDTKVAELKAEKAKLNPVTDAEKIRAIDKYVADLEGAKPIVIEAAKIGVRVEVDDKGKLTFEGPEDKVNRIKALLRDLKVRFKPDSGKIELDKLDPRLVQMLLNALKQLTLAYRPGYGAGFVPNYQGPGGYFNGAAAGFDMNGNPAAVTGMYGPGVGFTDKPNYGASNTKNKK